MPTSVLGTTSALTVFICLVLSVFLFVARSERVFANRLLGMFLLLTAIDMSAWFWYDKDISHSLLYALRSNLGALQMPCFLGFIIASCDSDFKLNRSSWLHFIPFLIFLYISLPGNQLEFIDSDGLPESIYISHVESVFNFILSNLQYYIYIAYAVYVLFRFRSAFEKRYSDARALIFSWLSQLVMVSLFAHTLVVFRGLIRFTSYQELYSYLQVFGALLVLAIITWITFKALLQPELFRGISRSENKEFESANEETKPAKKTPSQDPTIILKRTNLINHMLNEQSYLNAELTVMELSKQLGMTQRELSELINNEFDMHYFDFINSYRIKLAKEKLLADKSSTVLEVLYSVGFNSKSSFNTAFKKHTQTTPTAFRRANAS